MRRTRWDTIKIGSHILFPIIVILAFSPAAKAQQPDEQAGIDQGNYNIKQSVEFGYRFTDITGNQQTYNTFVNLQDGPRLLNFTTQMRSIDHHDWLFDSFYFSNFGYGGDPNVVTVLRLSKNHWYSFNAMFRHDENFWDYSLLGNPFNPATPIANAPASFNPVVRAPANVLGTPVVAMSPNYYNTRRNMQNYGVTFLPESKIRFRVGYNYNTNQGPSFYAVHEGTEQFVFQNVSNTLAQYRFGVDFRFLPKTTISYDQIWSYYKTDPGATDQNQQFSPGPGLPPVDLGVSWNGPPCSPAFQTNGLVASNCNAFSSYYTHRQTRTHAPTEQISLESSAIPNLQVTGRFAYTGSDMNVYNYSQSYAGFVSKSLQSNFAQTGPIQGAQVTSYADLGATWTITPMLRIVDEFHYGNWQQSAQFNDTECSFFSSGLTGVPSFFTPTVAVPPTCAPPADATPGTPTHNTKSGPDVFFNLDSNFLKQQVFNNVVEAQVQLAPNAGAYAGYRYEHRVIASNSSNSQEDVYFPGTAERGNCAPEGTLLPTGCTLNADGSVTYLSPIGTYGPPDIQDFDYNGAVLGFWIKPTPKLNITADADITSTPSVFTRIHPLQSQQFRIKGRYKATSWLDLSAYFLTTDGQNSVITVDGSQHNRNVGASLSITPSEKYSLQVGYNYNQIYSQIFLCFTSSLALPGLPACPGNASLLQELSDYTSNVHNGFLDFQWTPVKRLTFDLGGNISAAYGTELNLNPESPIPTQPSGALNSVWYEPYGSISYRFTKSWMGKALWNYYGYHEDSNGSYQDIYNPRNFRGNTVTLSLRYAF
jgi:hypothetical protein